MTEQRVWKPFIGALGSFAFVISITAGVFFQPGTLHTAVAAPTNTTATRAQDTSPADKWATVFGAKIHYLEAGSGSVVILLHGLGGNTSNWAPTISPLAQKYRVIVP